MADEKEVSLQSALKEFTISSRNSGFFEKGESFHILVSYLWFKLLLEPHGNKLTNSNELNAGKPTVTLCICNYLVLGLL